MAKLCWIALLIALLASDANAQGIIESLRDKIDAIDSKVEAILKKLDRLIPPLQPPPTLPPTPPVVITPGIPPPPAIPPPAPPAGGGPYYYVAPSGSDANPGTVDLPFQTLAKAVPLLKPGDTLIVRAGDYETGGLSVNANSIIPSGASWEKPVTLRAYPGERPVFRRNMQANHPYSEDEVRDSIHLPTYEECAKFESYGLVKDFPYSCWQGSGNNQPAGGLYFQTPKGFIAGYVVDLLQIWNKVEYVVFDGIDIDAKGITINPIGFSENAEHIRFQNLEIRYGVASCIAQSVPNELSHKDFDLQFYRVKIHSCGVPFDKNLINGVPARKHKLARYWHGWYLHAGGASFIESESYNHAGTGLGPDGNNIVVRDSYIHDNSAQGIYITGGDNWVIERNIFYNNGGAEIYQHSGKGHLIANNTLITGPSSEYGILLGLAAQGSLYRDNLIDGFRRGIYNTECGPAYPCFYTLPNTARNNLVRTSIAGQEIANANGATALIESGNIKGVDPMLDDKWTPRPGSRAIGSATDGGNIGAR